MTEMLPELPIDPLGILLGTPDTPAPGDQSTPGVVGSVLTTALGGYATVATLPIIAEFAGAAAVADVATNLPSFTAGATSLLTGVVGTGNGLPLGFLTSTSTNPLTKGLIDKLVPEIITGPTGVATPVLGAISEIAADSGLPIAVPNVATSLESLSDGVLNTVNALQAAVFNPGNNGLLDSDGAWSIASGALGTAVGWVSALTNPTNGTDGFINNVFAASQVPVGPVLGVAVGALPTALGAVSGLTGIANGGELPLDLLTGPDGLLTQLTGGDLGGSPLDVLTGPDGLLTQLTGGDLGDSPLDIVTGPEGLLAQLTGGDTLGLLDIVTGPEGLLSIVGGGELPLPLPGVPAGPGIAAEDSNPLSAVTSILGEDNPLDAVLGENGIVGSLTGGAAAGGALDVITSDEGLVANLTGGAGGGGALDIVFGDEGLLSGVVGGEGEGTAGLLLGEDGLVGSLAGGLSIETGLGGVVA